MTKKFYFLTVLLLLVAGALPVAAETVTIPTADGTYIDWNKCTLQNAKVENNGDNIGSTGAATVATFTIENATQQDYVLTFQTGAKGLTAEIDVTLTNSSDEAVLSKVAEVPNTGAWSVSAAHNYMISQLPVGTYTLRLATKSTTGSYAGNWGKLAFYTTSSFETIPGTINVDKGTYNGPRATNGEVGYVQNNGTALYSFINTEAGVYTMAMDIAKYNNGTVDIVVTDADTGTKEVSQTYAITESLAPASILLEGELTTGIKTMMFTFHNESGYICNYKSPAFTRTADHYATIAAASIAGQETTAGDGCDWLIQLPAASEATTTFSIDARYGSVSAAAEGIEITDNGNGTFTLPTPAPGNTTLVTLTLTPASGAVTAKTTYLLKIFRIGEISLTAATIDGVAISADLLSALNTQLTAEYQDIYTTMPVVKVQCVDGNWFEPTGDPVVANNKATYAFHITMAGKEKDYTLVVDGIHIYQKGEGDETVLLKYTGEENDKASKVWTNGLYSLSPVGDGWNNSGFKLSKNDNPFTLTVPVDVQVKQLIFREFSDNYAAGSVASITSEGATVYIPAKHNFVNGSKYDLIVNIDNHQAGTPIVFSFEGGSQTTGWYELTIEKVAVATPPVLKSQSVTSTTDKNHCVVALAFDREMADATATIGTQTVKAEGGNAVLYFSVWHLDYDTDYTFTVAAADAKDTHGNAIAQDITIPIAVGSKPAVEQKTYDYVVGSVSDFKAALAAVNESNKQADAERKVIFVKNGDYDFGSEEQNLKAYNVSIVGESMEGVILHGLRSDISNPIFQINNTGGDYFQDVTFRDDKDFDKAQREGVGVAISGGKKAVFLHVAMQSQQDTQVTGESGYYKDCKIYGAVDYICGGGDHFYDRCELIMTNGGYITAPSTNPSNKWGYVFQQCTINGYQGSYTYDTAGAYTFGRPWQGEPRCYFLNTTMNLMAAADGWSGMGTLTTHFYEYNTTDSNGQPVDVSGRQNSKTSVNTYSPFLNDDEAQRFTVENVLGGTDSWLPIEETVETAAPVVSVSDEKVLSWQAIDDARCYVILKDGQYVANTISTSWQAPENGIYSVRSANKNGGLFGTSADVEVKDATGITDVRWKMDDVRGEMYNLNGQRVAPGHKGIVIKNGRKMVVK